MAKKKPEEMTVRTGVVSVTNLPKDAGTRVKTTAVTAPSTEGKDARKAQAEGLFESIGATARGILPESFSPAADVWTPPTKANIRDIGEASFGAPPPVEETVHGPDKRVQITDTTLYPWRAIASLLITAADNSTWLGTGWFISSRTLITAGHCVYINKSGVPGRDGWVKKIDVMTGRNGATLPYASASSTVFKSVAGWTQNGDENFDYAGIILPNPLGDTVGVFGLGVYPDSDLQAATVNISGYPGDKPDGTQWYDSRTVAQVNSRKVYYDIDTAGGQSGAPVFRIVNNQRIAVAVHAYGGATTNSGTRINDEVYAQMKSWIV